MGLKNLLAKIAGKKIAKQLELQEGPMEDTKKWYKSKAVLSGIVTVLVAVYQTVDTSLMPQLGGDLPDIPAIVFTVLGAMGIYGRLSADKKIG